MPATDFTKNRKSVFFCSICRRNNLKTGYWAFGTTPCQLLEHFKHLAFCLNKNLSLIRCSFFKEQWKLKKQAHFSCRFFSSGNRGLALPTIQPSEKKWPRVRDFLENFHRKKWQDQFHFILVSSTDDVTSFGSWNVRKYSPFNGYHIFCFENVLLLDTRLFFPYSFLILGLSR